MVTSFRSLLSVITLITMFAVQSEQREELATLTCDGRGNFVVAMEYGLSLVGKTSLTFDIKACEFVVLAMTETIVIKNDVGNYILTILGHEENTKTVIKDSCFHCKARKTKKKKVLNCKEFTAFWMSWDDKHRTFWMGEGETINKNVLLKYRRRNMFPLYFLQVTSGKGITAEIRLYKEDEVGVASVRFKMPDPQGISVFSVAENAAKGTEICSIEVSGGQNQKFELVDNKELFQCDGASLKLIGNLDYEEKKSHFLTIRADSTYVGLTVNVIDVNDNIPTITMRDNESFVMRESPVGYVIRGLFTVTDPDSNDNLTVTIATDSENSKYFVLREDLGVEIKTSPIEVKVIKLSITVQDSVGHLFSKIHWFIIITNTPEECPTVEAPLLFLGPASDGSTVVRVQEGAYTKGQSVYQIKLSDSTQMVTFRLEGGGDDLYLEGLHLKINNPLVRRIQPVYLLRISFGDLVANFTLEVTPEWSERERMTVLVEHNGTSWEIPEELPVGYIIAIMHAPVTTSKFEIFLTGGHTTDEYKLIGPGSKYFRLNKTSGVLSIRSRIDRDGQNGVKNTTMEVIMVNTMLKVRHQLGVVSVIITDINDNVPTFSKAFYDVNITDNNVEDKTLLELPCFDADEYLNCDVTLQSDVGHPPRFKMSGSELIALAGTVKYNASKPTEVLEIITTDAAGPGGTVNTGRTVVFVNVFPRNDYAPVWIFPNMKDESEFEPLHVSDDVTSTGTTLTIFKAQDSDPHSQLTFRLINATELDELIPSNIFNLIPNTGELILGSDVKISRYLLCVSVSDGVHATIANIKIYTEHFNKHPPVFDKHWYVITRIPQNNVLKEFSVTDEDSRFTDIRVLLSENTRARGDQNSDWGESTDRFKIEKLKTHWRLIGRTGLDSYKEAVLLLRAVDGGNPELYGMATVVFNVSRCDKNTAIIQSSIKSIPATSTTMTSPSQITLTSPRETMTSPPQETMTSPPQETMTSPQHSVRSSFRSVTTHSVTMTSHHPLNTSQVIAKTSSSKILETTKVPIIPGRLVLRSTLFTDMAWEEFYKDSSEGKLIISDINTQLTSAFSSLPEFDTAQVQRLVNVDGSVTAIYCIYFTNLVNSVTIDSVLESLEKKPLNIRGTEYKQGSSAKCVEKAAVTSSQFDSMKLKIISIAEGVLIIIIILSFVIAKLCFNKNRAAVRPEDVKSQGYKQNEQELEEQARLLKRQLEELEKENVTLKTSVNEAKFTMEDEINVTDINKQTPDIDDMLNNQDSAFWSSHDGELDSPSKRNTEEVNDGGENPDPNDVIECNDSDVIECNQRDVTYGQSGSVIGCDIDQSNVCEEVSTEALQPSEGTRTKGQSMGSLVLQALRMKEKLHSKLNHNADLTEDANPPTDDIEAYDTANSDTYHDKTENGETFKHHPSGFSDIAFDVMCVDNETNSNTRQKQNGISDVVTKLMSSNKNRNNEVEADIAGEAGNDVLKDQKENDCKIKENKNKNISQFGFGDLVVDAMRFKYLLEDEVTEKKEYPMIYTQVDKETNPDSIDENETLNCDYNAVLGIISEDATEHDENLDDTKQNRTRIPSISCLRQESIPSILENTFDFNQDFQQPPYSTLAEHADRSADTADRDTDDLDTNSLLGTHLTYTDDMDVFSPVNMRSPNLIAVSDEKYPVAENRFDCHDDNKRFVSKDEDNTPSQNTFDHHDGNKHLISKDEDNAPSENIQSEGIVTRITISESTKSGNQSESFNKDNVTASQQEADEYVPQQQSQSAKKKSKRKKEISLKESGLKESGVKETGVKESGVKETGCLADETGVTCAVQGDTQTSELQLPPVSKKVKQKTSKLKKHSSEQTDNKVTVNQDMTSANQDMTSPNQNLTSTNVTSDVTSVSLGENNKHTTNVENSQTCFSEQDCKAEFPIDSAVGLEKACNPKTKPRKSKRSKTATLKSEPDESVVEEKVGEESSQKCEAGGNATEKPAKVEKKCVEKLKRRKKKDV